MSLDIEKTSNYPEIFIKKKTILSQHKFKNKTLNILSYPELYYSFQKLKNIMRYLICPEWMAMHFFKNYDFKGYSFFNSSKGGLLIKSLKFGKLWSRSLELQLEMEITKLKIKIKIEKMCFKPFEKYNSYRFKIYTIYWFLCYW